MRGHVIKAGASIAYHKGGDGVLALNQSIGDTSVVYAAGPFEVWHSKSVSVWDSSKKKRVSRPAAYRTVKRLHAGHTLLGGRFVKCSYAFVMRAEEVDEDCWRYVRDEFLKQVVLLYAWEGKNG